MSSPAEKSHHPARMPVLAVLALAAACASTELQQSWVRPNLGPLTFKKVAAVAIARDPARRRMMEDSMVGEIQHVAPDVQATASYTVIEDMTNKDKVREQFEQRGFDSSIVMRVTDVNRQDVYVPGRTIEAPVAYRTFWGYYDYWVPIAFQPGYVEQYRDVRVETEGYAFAGGGGDLVYSAVSRTLDPSSPADLANDVTSVVTRDMRDKGLLR